MTTQDHLSRVKALAANAARANPKNPHCRINGSCICPTCGIIAKLLHGALKSRCKTAERRVRVQPPGFDRSYPHLARVIVDAREVYRVHEEPTEVLNPDVLSDIERALGGPERC